jgi:hypothetical protein
LPNTQIENQAGSIGHASYRFTGAKCMSGDIWSFKVVLDLKWRWEKSLLPAAIFCGTVRSNAGLIASPRNFDAPNWK